MGKKGTQEPALGVREKKNEKEYQRRASRGNILKKGGATLPQKSKERRKCVEW